MSDHLHASLDREDPRLDAVLAPGGALDILKEKQKAGYVKNIGITSHQIDVAKKAIETNQFSTLMFPFNFMATEAADILLPICRKMDIGFISMKPLAGGMVGSLKLTSAEKKAMEQIKQELGPNFCHRCDYCQPCTVGIPISGMMTVKSFYKRLPPERFFGEMVGPMMEKASACTDCGKCEERCPYHLPIRKMIADQLDWFNLEKKRWTEAHAK